MRLILKIHCDDICKVLGMYKEVLIIAFIGFTCAFSLQRARAQHIVPCTISQLLSATLVDEVFRIGNVEISQVSKAICGRGP